MYLIFKVFGYGLAGVGIAADIFIIASEVKNLTNSELANYLEQLADDIDEKVQLMDFLQVVCAWASIMDKYQKLAGKWTKMNHSGFEVELIYD